MTKMTSRLSFSCTLLMAACLFVTATLSDFAAADHPPSVRSLTDYGTLPVSFERNQGQTDDQVEFISRNQGYTLFLTTTEAVLVVDTPPADERRTAIRMKFIGANADVRVEGHRPLPGKVNYFTGNRPENWQQHVPTYASVGYTDV